MTAPNEALLNNLKAFDAAYRAFTEITGHLKLSNGYLAGLKAAIDAYILALGPAHGIGVVSDEAREAYDELHHIRVKFDPPIEKLIAYNRAVDKILALGPQPSQPAACEKSTTEYDKTARKVVQFTDNDGVTALCDDGTIWMLDMRESEPWTKLPPIPDAAP